MSLFWFDADWQLIYCPRIPFFRAALGGLGPRQAEKSISAKFEPTMVSVSLPAIASDVPVAGIYVKTNSSPSLTESSVEKRRSMSGFNVFAASGVLFWKDSEKP